MTFWLTLGDLDSVVIRLFTAFASCGIFVMAVCTDLLPSLEMFFAISPTACALSDTVPRLLNALVRCDIELAALFKADTFTEPNFVKFVARRVKSAVLMVFMTCIALPSLCTPFARPFRFVPLTLLKEVVSLSSFPTSLSIASLAFVAFALISICSSSTTSAITTPLFRKIKRWHGLTHVSPLTLSVINFAT